MADIVAEIKQKRELHDLPDELIVKTVNEYLAKHKAQIPNNSKERKMLIKEIRAELRRYAGQYASAQGGKKIKTLIEQHRFSELLQYHSSTRERLIDYPLVKKIISDLKPNSILDIGCGLNPLAVATPNARYHAYDIKEDDLNIVHEFFKEHKIEGDIHHADVRLINNFPSVDICLMFKLLDIIGQDRNEITRKLLINIKSKYFIISFATRTLSGKPMNRPYRRWFEGIINELKYSYKVIRTKQELFYIITKDFKSA